MKRFRPFESDPPSNVEFYSLPMLYLVILWAFIFFGILVRKMYEQTRRKKTANVEPVRKSLRVRRPHQIEFDENSPHILEELDVTNRRALNAQESADVENVTHHLDFCQGKRC